MKQRPIQILLGVILIFVSVITFRNITQSRPQDVLRIADAQSPAFGLIYIAEEKGFFREDDLNIEYRKFSLGRDALEDMLGGHSDIATVFETPVVRNLLDGKPLSIISSLHRSKNSTVLVALKSHGISTVNDLEGKNIAVTKGTITEFFLHLLLLTNGIDESKVNIVFMEPAEIVEALKNQTVDGGVLFNPYYYRSTKVFPPGQLTIFNSSAYTEASMVVSTKDFAKNNREKLQKFMKGMVKAEEYVRTHQKESIEIIDTYLPEITADEITDAWNTSSLTLRLDNTLVTVMNNEARYFHLAGLTDREQPDIMQSIDISFLKAIKPQQVTLIKYEN